MWENVLLLLSFISLPVLKMEKWQQPITGFNWKIVNLYLSAQSTSCIHYGVKVPPPPHIVMLFVKGNMGKWTRNNTASEEKKFAHSPPKLFVHVIPLLHFYFKKICFLFHLINEAFLILFFLQKGFIRDFFWILVYGGEQYDCQVSEVDSEVDVRCKGVFFPFSSIASRRWTSFYVKMQKSV